MKTLPVCLILCFLSMSLKAQESFLNPLTGQAYSPSSEPWLPALAETQKLFDEERPLQLTLESDFTRLLEQKEEAEYQEGRLQWRIDDSLTLTCPVRVRPRGKSRLGFCHQPPLLLNLKKSELRTPGLEKLDKVKLVNQCRKEGWYKHYIIKEYLTYRILNLLTEKSFQVRLMDISYRDTGPEGNHWENRGFLIEDAEALADRIGAKELKDLSPNSWQRSDRDYLRLIALFQFMIGNTDWYLPQEHNFKFLVPGEGPGVYWPVPYDFDACGLVDAEYALPRRDLGLEDVRERKYLGYCEEDQALASTLQLFLSRREAIFRLIQDCPYLPNLEKKGMIRYLKEFYRIIEHPGKVERTFHRGCREWKAPGPPKTEH